MTYFSGPFLMALFSKLDGMMQNSLPVNLLLTGVIARLASYPQPLLRSFLLSHNLVFQPTVKSLLQVQNGLYMNVDSSIYAIALHVYSHSTGAKPVETGLAPVPDRQKKLLLYICLHLVKYIPSMFICTLLYDMQFPVNFKFHK